MGREIRQVPANWEHPKDENGHYKPLEATGIDWSYVRHGPAPPERMAKTKAVADAHRRQMAW